MKRLAQLRYRLLALVLIPLLLLSATVILLASRWSINYTYEHLFTKVNTDLRVAGESFERIQRKGQRELLALSASNALTVALAEGSYPALGQVIDAHRRRHGFDFLNLLSADANRILTPAGWQPHQLKISPLTRAVGHPVQPNGATHEPMALGVVGIEIYAVEEWRLHSGIDAEEVLLPLVATARAAPSERESEERAMIIRTLQPVLSENNEVLAILEGGVLLNRNFEFVDEIRDLVYGPGSLAPGSRGTVTVFLEDVRITTNVPGSQKSRALGTRVSEEVRDAVLNQGQTWVNRAFVVNDWYISAYEPIHDVSGERVGMLYAGYLEAPFRAELFKAIAVLSLLVIAGSLLAVLAAFMGARSIFAPIETMTAVVRATAAGEHRRIGPIAIGGEIGELANQFDAMLDTLESHRARIEHDAALLEDKVQHRTAELETQNRRLQDSIDLLHQTRQQLATAEKLAALGELTAGVAHEINNPTAVILGNMDVLVEDLGAAGEPVQAEIELIIEQVYRIRSIIDRLLQYSRSELKNHDEHLPAVHGELEPGMSPVPDRAPGHSVEAVSLQQVTRDALTLLQHEFEGCCIGVSEQHEASLHALIDRQEAQQVLVNLILNAIEAIGQHTANSRHAGAQSEAAQGQIHISTADLSDDTVMIVIRDTGCGISAQHQLQVFDPFFSNGKSQGTGLGLSVSYGIVRRYGGDIRVQSEPEQGSEFSVCLPGRRVHRDVGAGSS